MNVDHVNRLVTGLSKSQRAALIEMLGSEPARTVRIPRRKEYSYPLSFHQQQLWFLENLHPGQTAYQIPLAVKIRGELELSIFSAAMRSVVERHEVLRSRIELGREGAVERLDRESEWVIERVSVSELGEGEREGEVRRIVREQMRRPFHLEKEVPIRVTIVAVGERGARSGGDSAPHSWGRVVDGILIREMAELYAAYREGRSSGLEALAVQYGDYARWQREWLQGEVLEKEVEYWREQLRGVEGLQLPTKGQRPVVQTYAGSSVEVRIGREVKEKLRELGRREGATLFMVLLAGLQVMLSR